ncbi:MAG: hypothetical protein ACOYOB_16415 [Myxococcota bacterium]
MLSKAKLEEVLKGMGLTDAKILVEGNAGHLVAKVVSSAFNDQDEAARQARVWGYLYEKLTEAENTEVEFVFTVTPSEEDFRRFEDLAGSQV